MPAVLQGVRVVRLGSSLAGDYLCATLRDAGASIVEVGALPLDAGQAEAHKARVIINDLGRRAPVPHGLSFSDLASGNTNLVYCSLVSFPVGGPEGLPELEDDPVMALLGLNRLNGDAPKHEPLRVPSLYGALQAAIYISCALLPHIARRGTAQYIEVSLFSAALNVLGRLLVAFDDPAYRDPLSHGYRLPNAEPRRCADGR